MKICCTNLVVAFLSLLNPEEEALLSSVGCQFIGVFLPDITLEIYCLDETHPFYRSFTVSLASLLDLKSEEETLFGIVEMGEELVFLISSGALNGSHRLIACTTGNINKLLIICLSTIEILHCSWHTGIGKRVFSFRQRYSCVRFFFFCEFRSIFLFFVQNLSIAHHFSLYSPMSSSHRFNILHSVL